MLCLPDAPLDLALALLVLGILTDDHDFSLALNNLALLTNLLNRRSDFHTNDHPFSAGWTDS